MTIFKVIAVSMIAVLAAIQFKTMKTEYSTYITMAAAMMIGVYVIISMSGIFDVLERMKLYISGAEDFFGLIMKIIGITYLCELASAICKDAGYQAISSQIEVFGKVCIVLCGMPIILSLLQILESM